MKKPLYIFLHMPKCAGSTFIYHIQKNFKSDEYLEMYAKDFCFSEKHIGEYYIQEAVDDVAKLSKQQKDKIRIIFGHGIPKGIERHFPNREARYITFLRDPIARTISSYNFQRSRLHWDIPNADKHYYRTFVYYNGRPMSVKYWLEKKYDLLPNLPVGVTMTTFLTELNYLSKGATNSKKLEDLWKKFWFIGFTDTFDTDVLYLYKILGIHKFYRNRNVSDKYVKKPQKYIDLIKQKNQTDFLLMQTAHHHYVRHNLQLMEWKREIILPVSQGIENILLALYRFSANMRIYLPGYTRFINNLKGLYSHRSY